MRRRAGSFALAAGVLAFAAAFTWSAGRRGLFAFDQSIPFDAGWRVLSGQVPYRDFVLPTGPVLPWLQALGFAAFGVDFRGYLLTACAAAVVASAVAMVLTARLFPGRRALWAVAGLLTAVWFQAPAGTLWFEPVAYLAALAGLGVWAADLAAPTPHASRPIRSVAAGLLLVIAFLAKQSVALFLLPAMALLFLVEGRSDGPGAAGRRAAGVTAGAAGAAALFGAWLVSCSDPAAFAQQVFGEPGDLMGVRVFGGFERFALVATTGGGPLPVRVVLVALALGSGVVLLRLLQAGRLPLDARRRAVAVALALGLFACQNLVAAVSRNQPELAYTPLGVIAALAIGAVGAEIGAALRRRPGSGRAIRLAGRAVALAALGLLAARGGIVSLGRTAHEGVTGATRFVPVAAESLRPLAWAEPTGLREERVTAAEVEELLHALRERPGSFFVFPDWTILYGLLGRPSPQPLLWFHPGLTYLREGAPDLDRRIVRSLEEHRVATVVLERTSWFGTSARRADFPALDRYLESCFLRRGAIGPFDLLERGEDGARRRGCRRAVELSRPMPPARGG